MTIRDGGNPGKIRGFNAVHRMGPPPRSLAAEAHGCFMVPALQEPTEYKVAARCSRPKAGSPRMVSADAVAVRKKGPSPGRHARSDERTRHDNYA